MKNWLVVANASKARVLEVTDKAAVYVHIADLVHPQSRQKGSDLAGDRPGHVPGTAAHGTGSSAFDPRTAPRLREHERFAHEVAATLDEGIGAGRCAGLVLVASDPFLGQLKKQLSPRAHKALLRTVSADYTALSESELAHRLVPPSASQ